MIHRLISAIRIAYVSNIITHRHVFEKPFEAYQHPVVDEMFMQLKDSKSGVFVHWGVYESGKSTAAKQVAWRLQQEEGRTCILMHGYDFILKRTLREWFKVGIGVSAAAKEPVSNFFIKPTTIIIDHFDVLMHDRRVEDTMKFLRELASESETTQKFNVLVLLTSWERAVQLRDEGCYTIILPPTLSSRWTKEQLASLFCILSIRDTWKDDEKEELLRLAAISGTPGDLTAAIHGGKNCVKRAAMLEREWQMGEKALLNLEAAECENGVGRFPDRNGIFHWEAGSSS